MFFLDPFQEDVNVSPMVKRILSLVGIEKGRIRTNAVIDSTVVIEAIIAALKSFRTVHIETMNYLLTLV